MMKNISYKIKYQSGYTVLFGVIVLGAVALATIFAVSKSMKYEIKNNTDLLKAKQASILTDNCFEVALQRIKDNNLYVGSDNVSNQSGSCTYTVTSQGAENREIIASTVIAGIHNEQIINIDQINPVINISNWE